MNGLKFLMRRYPLYGRRVRVLPVPGLTGVVVGIMHMNTGWRYTVMLDNTTRVVIREFTPEELEMLEDTLARPAPGESEGSHDE